MSYSHINQFIRRDLLPDSKVHGTNMGPIWGRQDQGGPHVGPMNFAIWAVSSKVEILHSNIIKWYDRCKVKLLC